MAASYDLGSPFMAVVRIAVYAGFTLPCMVVQLLALALGLEFRRTFPVWYHRRCLKILGIRIEERGSRSARTPTLYVSNHVSYIDITILASLIAGSFVAKSEVASWPFFGWLAKLQRTVFVDRRPQSSSEQRDTMRKRLESGDNLILFPEGTSSDGNRILPFKSALFSVAEIRPHGEPLVVQPVSITYTKLDGVPMGRYLRPLFAWYGDMDLMNHMWFALSLGVLTVVVEFHEPVTIDQFDGRKALCRTCEQAVARGVSDALAGKTAPAGRTETIEEEAEGELAADVDVAAASRS